MSAYLSRTRRELLALLLAAPSWGAALPDLGSSVRPPEGYGLRAPRRELGLDERVAYENGRVRRRSSTDRPTGFTGEIGDLGAGPGAPLLGDSPYLGLQKKFDCSFWRLDCGFTGNITQLDLNARYFGSVPAPDPLLKDGSDPTKPGRESMTIVSAAAHAGRAVHLWGPFDGAVSAMAIGKLVHGVPSGALDQSASLRARLGQHNVAVTGGVTQTLALVSRDWAAQMITGGKALKPGLVNAPHADLGAWGPLPGLRGSYEAWIGKQSNRDTDVTRLSAQLSKPVPAFKGTATAGLRTEREDGAKIGFDRQYRALSLGVAQRSGVEWRVEAGRERVQLGGARYDGKSVMLYVAITDPQTNNTLGGALAAGSGEIRSERPQWMDRVQRSVADAAAAIDALLARGIEVIGLADAARIESRLREAFDALPEDLRRSIEEELGGRPIDFPRIAREIAEELPDTADSLRRRRATLGELEAALSDPQRLERVLSRFARVSIYEALNGTSIKLWGRETPMTPPLLLALAHGYGTGMTPLPAVTRDNFDPALERFLLQRLEKKLGLSCGGKDLVGCATDGLSPEIKAQIAGLPEQKARELLGDGIRLASEMIRLEVNRFLLDVYLSARQLDKLTVTRGEAPAALNRAALMQSYAKLDERRRRSYESAFDFGIRRLEGSNAAQLAAVEALLQTQGRKLAEEMRAAGIEAAPEDMSRLIADYGVESLRSFAGAAKSKLAARGATRLRLAYNEDPVTGGRIVRELDQSLTVSLPPAAGRAPAPILDSMIKAL